MLDLFPNGFEELLRNEALELVAYTDLDGEGRLRRVFGQVASEPVADDWADRWRSFHRSARIGPLWVGPPWEEPPGDVVAIAIDPGRAFGTGSHPTTRLCLELLLELEGGSLLDVGCGSGILAIAAAKLGFAPVHAVDADPAAVEEAAANAVRNDVEVETSLGDALTSALPRTDVAVANIALDTVEQLVPRLPARTIVVSGYLAEQRPALAGLGHRRRRIADGWAADRYQRE
jgi:ribosomal protein L11 methyltransferase